MWDFLIILGRVPGTNFQITFEEIVGFCLFAALLWLMRKRAGLIHLKTTLRILWLAWRIKKGQQLKLSL
jgi:hypothetical protein